jgi:hypothetical protein
MFFQQPQLQRLLGNDLLQSPSLMAKACHFAARGRTGRIASQATFAGLQELLRPAAIETFGDPFPAA